jgi:O-antigen/teichoic acid export membrane protein
MEFGKLLVFRFFTMTINLAVFVAAYLLNLTIETVIILHLSSNLIASLFSIFMNYSGIGFIKYFEKQKIIELIHFGKFSIGTLIGTNLLKSADTFILGLVSGTNSAALYSIPLKLTETFEVLLRSIVSVALPKMSNYSVKFQFNEVKRVFQSYSGLLTLIYVPAMGICFIFAEFFLQLLGGPEFVEMSNVFRMFCIYGLLLPIDRFTGVTLDCINRPNLNFKKVLAMALFNILFDIIALQFSSDLVWIAFGSVLTTLLGIILGLRFLNASFKTSFFAILESGLGVIKKAYL